MKTQSLFPVLLALATAASPLAAPRHVLRRSASRSIKADSLKVDAEIEAEVQSRSASRSLDDSSLIELDVVGVLPRSASRRSLISQPMSAAVAADVLSHPAIAYSDGTVVAADLGVDVSVPRSASRRGLIPQLVSAATEAEVKTQDDESNSIANDVAFALDVDIAVPRSASRRSASRRGLIPESVSVATEAEIKSHDDESNSIGNDVAFALDVDTAIARSASRRSASRRSASRRSDPIKVEQPIEGIEADADPRSVSRRSASRRSASRRSASRRSVSRSLEGVSIRESIKADDIHSPSASRRSASKRSASRRSASRSFNHLPLVQGTRIVQPGDEVEDLLELEAVRPLGHGKREEVKREEVKREEVKREEVRDLHLPHDEHFRVIRVKRGHYFTGDDVLLPAEAIVDGFDVPRNARDKLSASVPEVPAVKCSEPFEVGGDWDTYKPAEGCELESDIAEGRLHARDDPESDDEEPDWEYEGDEGVDDYEDDEGEEFYDDEGDDDLEWCD